jgi:hypothetical protein
MTDQPIIYWQDDISPHKHRLLDGGDTGYLVILENCADPFWNRGLTREEARSLGYALIARATVTSSRDPDNE